MYRVDARYSNKGGDSMTESESILVQIGEFVLTEIEGIKDVKHNKEQSFNIVTDDGKEFVVEIKRTK